MALLRDQFQVPGTRVLQFAFDGHAENPYLPHNFVSNTVAYTGTHDNPPTREWYEQLPDSQKQTLWGYLNRPLLNSGGSCTSADRAGMGLRGSFDDCAVTGRSRPRRWKSNECTRSCGRKLALALHRGDVVDNRFRMAVRIDREVEASRERGFKRSAAEGVTFLRANGSTQEPRTRLRKREQPD